MNQNKHISIHGAQRTSFTPAVPRLATKSGQQRQLSIRSANRGKANPIKDALRKMAAHRPGAGVF